MAAIGSLAASFDKALARQGRLLIGGDLSFELIHRQANTEERAALDALGQVSESASFRAMARSADGKTALIEVKAVDDAYPLYGEVVVLEPDNAGPAWRFPGVVLVERGLLDRLGVEIGSPLTIGEATVTIGGILGAQPDRLADRLAYGPKLLMSRETLARTGLVQPGTIRWTYRVKLPEDRASDKDALKETRQDIESRFPQSGFAIRDWTDPAPSLRRDADRFTQFVSFVGLTALLLGGIGVGDAIQSYMAKKREIIATFKCLGAPSRLVLAVYFIQALMLALVGTAIGLVLGASHLLTDRGALCRRVADHACRRAASAAAPHRGPRRPPHHGAVRALAARPRRKRLARGTHARPSQRGTRALSLALCDGIRGGRLGAVRARHCGFRGAHHHRLDLRRYRARFSPPNRLRAPGAALRLKIPPRQAPFPRARARQHRRTGIALRSIAVSLGLGLGLLVAVALITFRCSPRSQAISRSMHLLLLPRCRGRRSRRSSKPVFRHRANAKLDDAPMLRGAS